MSGRVAQSAVRDRTEGIRGVRKADRMVAFRDVIDGVGAIGSAAAAAAAVYIGVWQPRGRRPDLHIEEPKQDEELVIAGGEAPDGTTQDTAWVRLSVSARPGKEAATDVELTIVGISEICPRANQEPNGPDPPGIVGMALPVSASESPLSHIVVGQNGVEYRGVIIQETRQTRVHIPAGSSRVFDVAKVCSWKTSDGKAPLEIETAFRARDRRNEIMWGEIELVLAVAARNADARRYLLRLSFDGSWGSQSADIWSHLKVTKVDAKEG
jgi:hypothetical protein